MKFLFLMVAILYVNGIKIKDDEDSDDSMSPVEAFKKKMPKSEDEKE